MIKKINILLLILLLFTVNSCDLDLDLQDNPNSSTVDKSEVRFLLNSIQTSFIAHYNGINGRAMRYTRMEYQFGDYIGSSSDYNGLWLNYYANMLVDVQTLIDIASKDDKNFNKYIGIAKVLQAYSTVMMVDLFGNIPYTEALQSTDIPSPKYDNGEDIYPLIFDLINQAIVNLSDDDSLPIETDIYYGGDTSKWIKLAKTLKLKMYVQTRLYDEAASKDGINSLLAENDLINDSTDDFQFTYGTSISSPNNRHPFYSSNYNSSSPSNYMSNSYMYALKEKNDPRIRYYFYRQTDSDPTGSNLVCTLPPDPPYYYCYIGDGYWGRDHAISAGTPGDGNNRTTWGLYPAGGDFDHNQFEATESGMGAGGAGIAPIMLSSFVSFLKAEAALTISGVNGNASTYFQNGVEKSISKVTSFGGVNFGGMKPTSSEINDFIKKTTTGGTLSDGTVVNGEYNDAIDNETKLELIEKQYWIALRGNGIEAYNNYRRTGKPFLQSPQSSASFPRTVLYPSISVDSNPNAIQHSINEQVFWDTNPSNFID